MSVPNLKRIALFFQKLLWGPQVSKLGHVTLSHAYLGVTLWSGRSRAPSFIYVPNLKRISLFVQKLQGGSQISKFGQVTQATPTYASFYGSHAGGLRRRCLYQI